MVRISFIIIYLTQLIDFLIGFGLYPLLPVYAAHFGAHPSTIGLYLTCTHIAITLGTLFGGWLSDRIQKRKKLVEVIQN